MKIVRIRSFSGPFFLALELNTDRFSVSLRIQSKSGEIRTRKTPNTDKFYAVIWSEVYLRPCRTSMMELFGGSS